MEKYIETRLRERYVISGSRMRHQTLHVIGYDSGAITFTTSREVDTT